MSKSPAPMPTAPQGDVLMAPTPIAMGAMPAPAKVDGIGAAPAVDLQTSLYNDTFDVFLRNRGLFVSEIVNMLEVLTGWDVEHNFAINTWDPVQGAGVAAEGKGDEVLFMKEVSSCCERMWCGSNRSLKMGIVPSTPSVATFHPGFQSRDAMFSHPDGLVVEKPFKCTCCCWKRPVVYMSHNTIGRFATIKHPCRCCSYHFDVHAAHPEDGGTTTVASGVLPEAGAKWYTVHGTVCQPGVFCFCPCGECARVRFRIYDASDTELSRPVGEVARVFPGCCKAMATEADTFTVTFPTDGSPVKRASLISAVILMNYLFYDRRNDNNNN